MPFRYVEIKNTYDGTDDEALRYNRSLLSEGVKGVECLDVSLPTYGEHLDYTPFAPWGCYISSVERYANGAKNMFVTSQRTHTVVGYIIIRPLTKTESVV